MDAVAAPEIYTSGRPGGRVPGGG